MINSVIILSATANPLTQPVRDVPRSPILAQGIGAHPLLPIQSRAMLPRNNLRPIGLSRCELDGTSHHGRTPKASHSDHGTERYAKHFFCWRRLAVGITVGGVVEALQL
jgi:hypothetical protein